MRARDDQVAADRVLEGLLQPLVEAHDEGVGLPELVDGDAGPHPVNREGLEDSLEDAPALPGHLDKHAVLAVHGLAGEGLRELGGVHHPGRQGHVVPLADDDREPGLPARADSLELDPAVDRLVDRGTDGEVLVAFRDVDPVDRGEEDELFPPAPVAEAQDAGLGEGVEHLVHRLEVAAGPAHRAARVGLVDRHPLADQGQQVVVAGEVVEHPGLDLGQIHRAEDHPLAGHHEAAEVEKFGPVLEGPDAPVAGVLFVELLAEGPGRGLVEDEGVLHVEKQGLLVHVLEVPAGVAGPPEGRGAGVLQGEGDRTVGPDTELDRLQGREGLLRLPEIFQGVDELEAGGVLILPVLGGLRVPGLDRGRRDPVELALLRDPDRAGGGPAAGDPGEVLAGGENHPLEELDRDIQGLRVDPDPVPALVDREPAQLPLHRRKLVAVAVPEVPAVLGVLHAVLDHLAPPPLGDHVLRGLVLGAVADALADVDPEPDRRRIFQAADVPEVRAHVEGAVPVAHPVPAESGDGEEPALRGAEGDLLIEGGVVGDQLPAPEGLEVELARPAGPVFGPVADGDQVRDAPGVPGVAVVSKINYRKVFSVGRFEVEGDRFHRWFACASLEPDR